MPYEKEDRRHAGKGTRFEVRLPRMMEKEEEKDGFQIVVYSALKAPLEGSCHRR